jgi:hypothetical protein
MAGVRHGDACGEEYTFSNSHARNGPEHGPCRNGVSLISNLISPPLACWVTSLRYHLGFQSNNFLNNTLVPRRGEGYNSQVLHL